MSDSANHFLNGLIFGEQAESDPRLRELVLYIADKSYEDGGFGAIKLNKIIYFSDFESYARYGQLITGSDYISLPNGPAPKRLIPVRKQMVEGHEISIRNVSYYGKEQHRVIPLRDANLMLFTARDIAIVDAVIDKHWGKTARQMSDLSHDRIWRIAGTTGAPIPKEAVFISSEDLTDYDIQRTRELAAEHGWRERERI